LPGVRVRNPAGQLSRAEKAVGDRVCVCVTCTDPVALQAMTTSRPASSLSKSYASYLVRYAADPKRTEFVVDHACVKGSV
jgi:hypothetical protein